MKKIAAVLCLLMMFVSAGPFCAMKAADTLTAQAAEQSSVWFSGKTWVAYGDSIPAGYGLKGYAAHRPENNQATNSYIRQLANKYGMTCYNYAYGGSGYGRTARIDLEGVMAQYRKPDADIVSVALGTNDFSTVSAEKMLNFGAVSDLPGQNTFCGSVRSMLIQLIDAYPNAELFVVLPCARKSMYKKNYVGKTLIDYSSAIREIAEDYDLNVIDPADYVDMQATDSAWCETYMPDGLHPNALGHAEYMLPMMEKGLKAAADKVSQPKEPLGLRSSLSLLPGAEAELTASGAVEWMSADRDIATVSEHGTVNAVRTGTANIIAVRGHSREVCRVQVRRLATPQTEVSFDGSAVRLSWNAVEGARDYLIYRKTDASSWRRIGVLKKKCTYTDEEIDFSSRYSYAVRAQTGSSHSGYQTVSCSTGLDRPGNLTAVRTSRSSIGLSWDAVKYADGYRVYEKVDGKWKRLTQTAELRFSHTGLKLNSSHLYTVRAFRKIGNATVLGAYDAGGIRASTALAQPGSLRAASAGNRTIRLSWKAVADADGYRVYRKTKDGWKYAADTAALSVQCRSLNWGSTYTYTVRAYEKIGTGRSYGLYSKNGVSARVIPSTPKLTGASAVQSGIRVKWGATSDAQGYVVYRKSGSGGWSSIAKLGKISAYTDKSAKRGVTYTYAVRACCAVNRSNVLSGYDAKGVSAKMQ